MTSLIIADDHPLLMAGAIEHIKKLQRYKILGTAANGNDAYQLIATQEPDIAILDMKMPIMSGLEVAKVVHEKKLKTSVIILTLYKEESILKEVGHYIRGYVTKDTALVELDQCLKDVSNGKLYISPKLKGKVLSQAGNEAIESLTPTEIKILNLVKDNLTSAQIGERLFVSKRTVEKHRSNVVKKLGLQSGANALYAWVIEHKELFDWKA